ncbi:hypothetical protein CDAR_306111 [Caerostris darwini]|uniref:Uncharacterized protein n=1 Tax=Caerostris darwini TaxID=1538125 RepID=A0AAV4PS65_9ARAC|nr:hypothetical protein CDAR_306111 [Caerostris darwini]
MESIQSFSLISAQMRSKPFGPFSIYFGIQVLYQLNGKPLSLFPYINRAKILICSRTIDLYRLPVLQGRRRAARSRIAPDSRAEDVTGPRSSGQRGAGRSRSDIDVRARVTGPRRYGQRGAGRSRSDIVTRPRGATGPRRYVSILLKTLLFYSVSLLKVFSH